MKRITLLLLSTFAFCFNAQAQITLDANNFPNIGETIINVNANVNASLTVGNPGANQVYDFSSVTPIDSTTNNLVDPSTTAGGSAFPSATHAAGDASAYLYLQETMDAILQIGIYTDIGAGQFLAVPLTPPSKVFEIPTTYNTNFTDEWGFSVTIEDISGTAGVDSLRSTSLTTREVLFDGYGTISTPDGTYDALRERIYATNTNLIEALTLLGWIEFSNETTVDTSYSWYAAEASGPLVSIGILNGAISNITYMALPPVPMAPIAGFSTESMGGGLIDFTDTSNNLPTSWFWDFGDGTTSTQQNPNHTYSAAGDYTVCLTVTNDLGSDMVCQTLSVSFAPIAAFEIINLSNGAFDFIDQTLNNPTTWLWDFGDGNTSALQNPAYSYSSPGIYTVCLTASNAQGSDMTCVEIFIELAPLASFVVIPQTPGEFLFMDESTNVPTTWLWDFGDGNTSTLQNPTHSYATPGIYIVCLTVSNNSGSDVLCEEVEVVLSPLAAFSYVDGPEMITLTDESTNNPDTWSWDFGDGNTSDDQNPVHSYETAAEYTICLTASNSAGSDVTCQTVNIIAGTNELVNNIDLTIYPNPIQDKLHLQIESNNFETLDFQLFNTLGQAVLESRLEAAGMHHFDVKILTSGIYHFVVRDEKGLLRSNGTVVK